MAFQYLRGRKELVSHTYAEFYQTVVYLGTYMLKRGIRGRKIALVGENSYEWLLCYFAIVTTGNVAVLVAKDATPAEASTLIFQSEADVVVTSRKYPYEKELLAQKLVKNKYCFSMREFDEWEEKGKQFHEKGRNLYDKVTLDPEALSTIFFTSGTSGTSKGVMLSQRNLLSNVNDAPQVFQPEGCTLAILPFTHVFGLSTAVLMMFYYGHPIVISNGLSSFMRELSIVKPSILFLVPLFVETFSNTIWRTAQKQGQTVEHIIWHLWRLEKCFPVKEESRDPCCEHPDGASDCQISQCKLQILASDGHSRAKDSLLQIRLMECDHDQSHYITQYGD